MTIEEMSTSNCIRLRYRPRVPTTELVPGMLKLEEGLNVLDIRLLKVNQCKIDESALTANNSSHQKN